MEVFEHKYEILPARLPDLRRALLPFLIRDPHSAEIEGQSYRVSSLYFDTPSLDMYHQKLSGIRNRRKIRIRVYNGIDSSSRAFLEIKQKENNAVTKVRASVPLPEIPGLFMNGGLVDGVPDSTEQLNVNRFLYQIHRYLLRPVILIIYEREAYYYRLNPGLRITFDKNMRCVPRSVLDFSCNGDRVIPMKNVQWILEVKTSIGMPLWLLHTISGFQLHLQAISKYTLGLESLVRDDWRHVIQVKDSPI